jgi:protein-S-isoprenylcysteine O-methyltransferase Ste14
VFVAGLVVLSVMAFSATTSAWRFVIGLALLIVGFGLAFRWTSFLGWKNAFGDAQGLKTEGIYRWSRHPIYVFSKSRGWSAGTGLHLSTTNPVCLDFSGVFR